MRGLSCRIPLVLAALAFTCFAGQDQAPRRTVTGSVVNSVSGEPVRHALVQLWASRSASVLTGPDGRFEIPDVAEGPVNFGVTKPGFFDSHSLPGTEWRHPRREFVVGPGKNDFLLKLIPAAKIVGRVTGADGDAIEQAQLQILAEQLLQGHKSWQLRSVANTNDDGSYRVDDLLPGRYVVFVAGQSQPAPNWDAAPEVFSPAFFPDAPDLASAQRIEIRAGDEFRADFRLSAERGFRVAGQFGGIPAGLGLSMSLKNSTGQAISPQGMEIDAGKGRFVLQAVPAGSWTVVLSANDAQGHLYEARQEISIGSADITGLVMLLHPAASIPMVVNRAAQAFGNDSGGQQPLDAQPPTNPGVNATLISADPFNPEQYGMTARGDSASMAFENIREGKYKLDIQGYGNECIESAWYGNSDVLRNDLVVSPDAAVQPLTINLRSDCATLSAQIDSGDRLSGEQPDSGVLLIVPDSYNGEPRILPAPTRPLGSNIGPGNEPSLSLSPGSYQVFAFSSLDGLEYGNPEALRGYPSQSIDLSPGQKAELTVKLIERKVN